MKLQETKLKCFSLSQKNLAEQLMETFFNVTESSTMQYTLHAISFQVRDGPYYCTTIHNLISGRKTQWIQYLMIWFITTSPKGKSSFSGVTAQCGHCHIVISKTKLVFPLQNIVRSEGSLQKLAATFKLTFSN